VRELVANALVHRDLAEWASSRSIDLRLTNTTMRITNPGGLYGITAERLGVHPLTSARNRRLLEICKFVRTGDANVVEALASGIPATIAALAAANMPPPRPSTDPRRRRVARARTRRHRRNVSCSRFSTPRAA
jgi:ATP-dependent DNA helicase RecG